MTDAEYTASRSGLVKSNVDGEVQFFGHIWNASRDMSRPLMRNRGRARVEQ